jgi:hypothetical protein
MGQLFMVEMQNIGLAQKAIKAVAARKHPGRSRIKGKLQARVEALRFTDNVCQKRWHLTI